jgi:hypothetical protein
LIIGAYCIPSKTGLLIPSDEWIIGNAISAWRINAPTILLHHLRAIGGTRVPGQCILSINDDKLSPEVFQMENGETRLKVAFNGALRELEKEISRIRAEIETAKDSERLRPLVTRLMTIIIMMDDLAAQPGELQKPADSLFFEL